MVSTSTWERSLVVPSLTELSITSRARSRTSAAVYLRFRSWIEADGQCHRLATPLVTADLISVQLRPDVLPAIADRPADEDFVRAPPVGVRGIEERDTKVDRAVERPDRFFVVAGTVTLRHSHAAEPD